MPHMGPCAESALLTQPNPPRPTLQAQPRTVGLRCACTPCACWPSQAGTTASGRLSSAASTPRAVLCAFRHLSQLLRAVVGMQAQVEAGCASYGNNIIFHSSVAHCCSTHEQQMWRAGWELAACHSSPIVYLPHLGHHKNQRISTGPIEAAFPTLVTNFTSYTYLAVIKQLTCKDELTLSAIMPANEDTSREHKSAGVSTQELQHAE